MALGLARANDVTVLTRANNRPAIDHFLTDYQNPSPNFLYVDPSSWALHLKRLGIMPVQLFYALWQSCVAKLIGSGGTGAHDIVHQLTFNSFEIPPVGFLKSDAVKVWGPVGGGQRVAFRLLPAFGLAGGIKEWMRNLRIRLSVLNPMGRKVLKCCSLVLFANKETENLLAERCTCRTEMMIDVGVDLEQFAPPLGQSGNMSATILFAGRLEHRKGAQLLLDAIGKIAEDCPDLKLRLAGGGPMGEMLDEKARRLGLEEKITFTGMIGHAEMQAEMANADIFAFPSLRDTSGAVVLEAMAMRLPVVCFDHQGAAIMVADGCGLKVPAPSLRSASDGLADAIRKILSDPGGAGRMGVCARQHVGETHDWAVKVGRINRYYRELLYNE